MKQKRIRWEEPAAERIVARVLGVEVEDHDNGERSSMVDAFIHLPEGKMPMEVFGVNGDQYNALAQVLDEFEREIKAPTLTVGWQVDVEHRTRMRKLAPSLERHLAQIETDPVAMEQWPVAVPTRLAGYGVKALHILRDQPGLIRLYESGWSLDTSHPPTALTEFADAALRDAPDVPAKLGAVAAEQRHAFIWVMPESGEPVGDLLWNGQRWPAQIGGEIKHREQITHVWVATTMSDSAVLLWSHGEWAEVTRTEPADFSLGPAN